MSTVERKEGSWLIEFGLTLPPSSHVPKSDAFITFSSSLLDYYRHMTHTQFATKCAVNRKACIQRVRIERHEQDISLDNQTRVSLPWKRRKKGLKTKSSFLLVSQNHSSFFSSPAFFFSFLFLPFSVSFLPLSSFSVLFPGDTFIHLPSKHVPRKVLFHFSSLSLSLSSFCPSFLSFHLFRCISSPCMSCFTNGLLSLSFLFRSPFLTQCKFSSFVVDVSTVSSFLSISCIVAVCRQTAKTTSSGRERDNSRCHLSFSVNRLT